MGVAEDLNLTNLDLDKKVHDLVIHNENYSKLNEHLNSTTLNLSHQVHVLNGALTQLVIEKDALLNLTVVLEETSDRLSNITVEQNKTYIELQDTLDILSF